MKSKYKKIILAVLLILSSIFLVSGYSESYWLQEDAWNDRPSYAEDISINYNPTDFIQEREAREVCTGYSNTTLENGTTVETCDGYENESFAGQSVSIFEFNSSNNEYLGNGVVRTQLVIGLNTLSLNTLMEDTILMSESEYISWFNDNYYYNGSNITSSNVDELQSRLKEMYASGDNVKAGRVNGYTVTSLDPFRAEANTTMVYKFEDFRTGRFQLSDLVSVEVESNAAN